MPPDDLPPWLRPAPPRRGAGARRRPSGLLLAGLLLLAAGGGAGYLIGLRRAPQPAAAPPICPPAVACVEAPPAATHGPPVPPPTRVARHGKPARADAPLVPLPDRKPMDEGQRTQALRAFAAKRAPELRDCMVGDPGQGSSVELGAAFEISANGAVDMVQILGADASPKEVRRCYAGRLKKWRFPEELLRGEEKLLVNFVL